MDIDSNANINQVLEHTDSAVIKTMEMYQAIITRMASNSAACKKWCIPLVTAIIVLAVKEKIDLLICLSIIPVLICYSLDAYYLMLENRFRTGFNQAADKIAQQSFTRADLFNLSPAGSKDRLFLKAYTSLATWPVYLSLLVLLVIAYLQIRC